MCPLTKTNNWVWLQSNYDDRACHQRGVSIYNGFLSVQGFPSYSIGRLWDHLIIIIAILLHEKMVFILRKGPGDHLCGSSPRVDSRFVPSQWEMALHCNDVSHWLGASLESALISCVTLVKSLQLLWRLGTHWWNLRVPDLQVNCC